MYSTQHLKKQHIAMCIHSEINYLYKYNEMCNKNVINPSSKIISQLHTLLLLLISIFMMDIGAFFVDDALI